MFPDATSKSSRLHARARAVLPGGNTRTTVYMRPYPIYAARGQGCRVWDVDGISRIDCINNFTSMIHGYATPQIIEAVSDQLAIGSAFGLPTQSEIELAELLCGRVASVERVRFTNSGSEAVMMALKAARAFTGRNAVAKCEGAYHGSYDYAEVSLDPAPDDWKMDAPASLPYSEGTPQGVLDDVVTIPFNDSDAAAEIIRQQGDRLAAILVDPMPNRAGLVPAEPAFIEAIFSAAREVGTLVVFDEVISFRLAHAGAQSLWDVSPDLTVFGKIIGGGFPVGAVGGRADVMAVFDPTTGKPRVPHGGTFSANPVSMRAGLVAMQLLDHAAFEHLEMLGERARHGINGAFRETGVAGVATGLGSLVKVHFTDRHVRDYRSAYQRPDEARRLATFTTELLNLGILPASYGLMAFSTVMTSKDIDEVAAAARRALERIAAGD